MADLSAYNFEVTSSVHNYNVNFVDDFSSTLASYLRDDDAIIIDKNVLALYDEQIGDLVRSHTHYAIEPSEETKSYLGVVPIIEHLLVYSFRKSGRLIAIGGGITQDATAFVASILFRGVEWALFPTTLLAQCDSSIGSKIAINFATYKNQVGGFYPPRQVFIDLGFLDTLPDRDQKSGMGEMLHYYIVSGEEDYARYQREYDEALKDREVLRGLLFRCLQIKKKLIEIDEFDKKERQVFNYGHSFGHALEAVTNYRLPHGIAVTFGMDMANFVSEKLGFIDSETFEKLHAFLMKVASGFAIGTIDLDAYLAALSRDKKNTATDLGLILMKGVGQTQKTPVKPDEQFRAWMQEYFDKQSK
jgi:3-dehydroquinate synthase